jgi:serine/threonine protein kinase
LNQIEEGSYGVVFRAREKSSGDIVALKKLKLDEEKHGFPITALREINALMSCRHQNVVSIREVVVGETLTQYVLRIIFLGPILNPSKSIRGDGFHRTRSQIPSDSHALSVFAI